jgi:putative inorganic carbon (HCO3(-)) transporter
LSEVARAGGVVGALGLALLIVAPRPQLRIAGLAAWAAGCGALALWLAPSASHRLYAAAAACGLLAAAALAWLFVRVPWVLAVAVLACAPARIPVSVGDTKANLLVPIYLVVAAAALALVWELFGDDDRSRELGFVGWPLALFVAWTGVSYAWTADSRQGGIFLLFFLLPFGLLAVALARLRWSEGWATVLYVQLTAMALVFAAIGGWQYLTRDIFWNPKVIVDNAYAPSAWFYRVNSVFYDPSIYGRFLVVAIVASLVLVLFGRGAIAVAAAVAATATWLGLLPSFSQSSFVSLGVAAVVGLAVLWWRRAVIVVGVAAILVLAAGFTAAAARNGGLSDATSGRSKLVENGVRLAVDHPVAGVGAGGFRRAYADRVGLKGKEPKAAASHDTPVTVAAETGAIGLALFAWLLGAAFFTPLRRLTVSPPVLRRARVAFGLGLLAIVVHSLFYNALFEDPLFWGLLALGAVAAREVASG